VLTLCRDSVRARACRDEPLFLLSHRAYPARHRRQLEFVGPLGVAVAGSRLFDLLWVVLAGVGIVMLAPLGSLTRPAWRGARAVGGQLLGCIHPLGTRTGRAFQVGRLRSRCLSRR